jgi:hypothetical protein
MMYADLVICDSIDIKFRMGQQASGIVKMSDYDLCLMAVLACCLILYNAQIEKITPAGG